MQDSYLKYFGLSESAFNLASDPRFFYANRAYQHAFLALRYGIKIGEGMIVLTGASGAGKTSLIALIKDRCESNVCLSVISARGQDYSDLLRVIARALGLKVIGTDQAALLHGIRGYSAERLKEKPIHAVVLDEAQDLDFDTLKQLEALAQLQSCDRSLLRLVLVGRPELETTLNDPALESFKKRVAVWCRVEPLKTDEVGTYIDHRLTRAGHQEGRLFHSDAVERIAACSKGIPGLINAICDKALFSAYTASHEHVTAETIDRVWHTLQLTGECEFEVAALLSEIRDYSRFAAEHPSIDCPEPRVQARNTNEEQFRLDERTTRPKRKNTGAGRGVLPWLAMFRRRAQQETSPWLATLAHRSWCQTKEWIGMLRERARQNRFYDMRTLRTRMTGQSRSRWLGWSAVIAILVLTGSVGLFYYYNVPRKNPALNSPNAVNRPTNSAPAAELRQPAEASQQAEAQPQAELPNYPKLPPQLTEASLAEEKSPLQIVSSPSERVTKPRNNHSAPIVYVHTSEERDLSVLEEIGNVLRVGGYSVRGARFTRNRTQGDVRFFFPRDRDDAERIKSVVQSELDKRGYPVSLQLLERDGRKFENAAPGKIEVWLPPLANGYRIG